MLVSPWLKIGAMIASGEAATCRRTSAPIAESRRRSCGHCAKVAPMLQLPTYEDVQAAARRLQGQAHRTPVLRSTTADRLVNAQVFFKCENFQRMGAFKFRGAYNALSKFDSAQRRAGVIAFSSGNHAQAIALAARLLGIPATIVMPLDAPQ